VATLLLLLLLPVVAALRARALIGGARGVGGWGLSGVGLSATETPVAQLQRQLGRPVYNLTEQQSERRRARGRPHLERTRRRAVVEGEGRGRKRWLRGRAFVGVISTGSRKGREVGGHGGGLPQAGGAFSVSPARAGAAKRRARSSATLRCMAQPSRRAGIGPLGRVAGGRRGRRRARFSLPHLYSVLKSRVLEALLRGVASRALLGVWIEVWRMYNDGSCERRVIVPYCVCFVDGGSGRGGAARADREGTREGLRSPPLTQSDPAPWMLPRARAFPSAARPA
jgi:hypothetical protein